MDLLKLIAETLLEYETITKEQIDYLVKNGHMPEEDIKAHEEFEKTAKQEEEKQEKQKIKEEKEGIKIAKLEDLSLEDLKDIAKEEKLKDYDKLSKKELIDKLKEKQDK